MRLFFKRHGKPRQKKKKKRFFNILIVIIAENNGDILFFPPPSQVKHKKERKLPHPAWKNNTWSILKTNERKKKKKPMSQKNWYLSSSISTIPFVSPRATYYVQINISFLAQL